jgi:hypothetical protein
MIAVVGRLVLAVAGEHVAAVPREGGFLALFLRGKKKKKKLFRGKKKRRKNLVASCPAMDTTLLDVPNSKAIAKQLLELSQDPANQPFIVQEQGCLQGLVSYTQHSDQDVVIMAVRTLQFLSTHPQNKKAMRDFPALVDKLTLVSLNATTHSRAKEFAALALVNLGVLTQQAEVWWGEKENTAEDVVDSQTNTAAGGGKFHTLVMQVDGLDDAGTCAVAQRVLVNVKGVISVSIDKARGHALVGTRENGECGEMLVDKLQDALMRAGISSSPWPPAQPLNHNLSTMSSSGEDDSGYLDAAEYEALGDGGGALTRWGHSSLEARLAEQRREEEMRMERAERLLNKVRGVLSSAGNWLMGW